jgi:hypothetical protein
MTNSDGSERNAVGLNERDRGNMMAEVMTLTYHHRPEEREMMTSRTTRDGDVTKIIDCSGDSDLFALGE